MNSASDGARPVAVTSELNVTSAKILLQRRAAGREPLTFGVPWPKGSLYDAAKLALLDESGRPLLQPLAFWADGSMKWLLIETLLGDRPEQATVLKLTIAGHPVGKPQAGHFAGRLRLDAAEDRFQITAGENSFEIIRSGAGPLAQIAFPGKTQSARWSVVLQFVGRASAASCK